MCADTRRLLHYFRLLPDGRFLWGGRGGISGSPAAARRAQRHLRRSFERHFPAWRHVETEYFWRGLVCLTRSEEHTSELQSLMLISYAVFCLKKKKIRKHIITNLTYTT